MEDVSMIAGARFHETLAASWAAGYAVGSFRQRLRFFEPFLDRFVVAGTHWLDAGCGSGVLARQLATRGAHVVAMDASPAMLAHASAASQEDGTIEYRHIRSIESLPLPDGSADGILCSSVIEYVDDPVKAVREFSRVLASEAVLIVTVPNRLSLIRAGQRAARACGRSLGRSWFPYLSVSKHSFTVRRISAILEQSGFSIEDMVGFSPFLPSALVPLKMGALWLAVARRLAA